jgi:hypothetical protein
VREHVSGERDRLAERKIDRQTDNSVECLFVSIGLADNVLAVGC